MRARATILEIQILRAVAALAVVVMHVGVELRYWSKATIAWTDVGNWRRPVLRHLRLHYVVHRLGAVRQPR